MTKVVEIDMRDLTVTPIFKLINLENIPKSEEAGHPIMEMREVVEVRFAGSNNYSPIFPSDGFWKREGNRVITYAERWPEQYMAFKNGNPQESNGTPLEMLRPYGITPEELSLCRALKIYSIEALHHLDGQGLKNLGMKANSLKDVARKYMADRGNNISNINAQEEIEALKKEIEMLKNPVPVKESTSEEIDEALYGAMNEQELRDLILEKTGEKPDGRLGHAALVNLAKGM